jgi:hypothetical protein
VASASTHLRDLNPGQLEVLRWVAAGCPEGRYEGYSHRVSAAALKTRGLVIISGRGSTWKAALTARGAPVAELADKPVAEQPVSTPPAKKVKPDPPTPKPPGKAEQLIAELVAAGGVMRVPYWREQGQPDYRARVSAAQRFNKVPAGKELVLERVRGGQLEIRLEQARSAEAESISVDVPGRLTRPHPVAARYRDQHGQHQVSRSQLARSVRIIHALAVAAETRGHQIENVRQPRERSPRDAGKQAVAHIVVTVANYGYSLGIQEEKVLLRGIWEERKRLDEEHRQRWPTYTHHERLRPYDADGTGLLTLSLVDAGYRREGRPPSWSDRKSWSLEEKLPEVLLELERRADEDARAAEEERQRAVEAQRKWETDVERAKELFIEAHRANELKAQVNARREAEAMRAYLVELEAAHGESAVSAEWIAWIRSYIDKRDPLTNAPEMPVSPDISREDLKPFLPPGVNPYGPQRW